LLVLIFLNISVSAFEATSNLKKRELQVASNLIKNFNSKYKKNKTELRHVGDFKYNIFQNKVDKKISIEFLENGRLKINDYVLNEKTLTDKNRAEYIQKVLNKIKAKKTRFSWISAYVSFAHAVELIGENALSQGLAELEKAWADYDANSGLAGFYTRDTHRKINIEKFDLDYDKGEKDRGALAILLGGGEVKRIEIDCHVPLDESVASGKVPNKIENRVAKIYYADNTVGEVIYTVAPTPTEVAGSLLIDVNIQHRVATFSRLPDKTPDEDSQKKYAAALNHCCSSKPNCMQKAKSYLKKMYLYNENVDGENNELINIKSNGVDTNK
jgi:hypothetical protein